jgi:hypothetical protein
MIGGSEEGRQARAGEEFQLTRGWALIILLTAET